MGTVDAITNALVHEDMLIGTALSHFHAVKEAQNLAKIALKENPIVSFGKKVEGAIAYSHNVTPATLEHACIRVSSKDTATKYRYFKRIHAADGTRVQSGQGHGLSASAWVETDTQGRVLYRNGTCELKLCYPGYPREPGAAQTQSMVSSLYAEFPQAREVGPFLDKVLEAAKAMHLPIGSVTNTSWSIGSANALASNLYFKHRGIPSIAMLGDPWRASDAIQTLSQRNHILRSLLDGSQAEAVRYTRPQLLEKLTEDVISVYPATKTQAGAWQRTSGTAPGKYPIIKKILIPSDAPVGRVFHIDAGNMEVLAHERVLGNTHHRTNIIHHLATNGDSALHEIVQVATRHSLGRNIV